MDLSAELELEIKTRLGEGAIWDPRHRILGWVDILEGRFFLYDPASKVNRVFELGSPVGTAVPRAEQGWVLALKDGVVMLDEGSGEWEMVLANPDSQEVPTRFNDGKCDPQGRLWVGTMGMKTVKNKGTLYRIQPDLTCDAVVSGLSIPNGIVWNAAGDTMFHIDTPRGTVFAYPFEGESGELGKPEPVVTFPEASGGGDGMTIDAEDKLWVAHWGGYSVCRWDPETGDCLSVVDVPAPNVTSCAFGGADFKTLFITTASVGMPAGEEDLYPLAGSLFKVEPGVSGVPAHLFMG